MKVAKKKHAVTLSAMLPTTSNVLSSHTPTQPQVEVLSDQLVIKSTRRAAVYAVQLSLLTDLGRIHLTRMLQH